jgi:hypothetical protein
MQSISASDSSPEAASPGGLNLNGLKVTVQGESAAAQVKALRTAFPESEIELIPNVPARSIFLRRRNRTEIAIYISAAVALMIVGHLLFSYLTLDRVTLVLTTLEFNGDFWYYLAGRFCRSDDRRCAWNGVWCHCFNPVADGWC